MGGGPVEPSRFAERALTLRWATKDDLDAITSIVVAAFPDDPGCDYKYPYRQEHPEDFWKWTRLEYEGYINQPDKFASLVVTTPVVVDHDLVVNTPIAVGIWDIAVTTDPKDPDPEMKKRHDANPRHMAAYAETMSRSFDKYFSQYGHKQIHLWMLMTHPQFRRRGAGTMLCNWGLQKALEKGGWILTLMASPMGKELYRYLGYVNLGTETAQIEGEEDKVDIFCMEKENK